MITSLTFRKYRRMTDCVLKSAETAERMFSVASILPMGQFLGWNVQFRRDGRRNDSFLSSEHADVSKEDLSWIFEDCASIGEDVTGSSKGTDGLCIKEQNVYVLKRIADKPYEEVLPDGRLFEPFVHMTRGMELSLRFIAGPEAGDSDGYGMLLILSNEKLPLRVRSLFPRTFPGTVLQRVEAPADEVLSTERLPGSFALSCLKKVLYSLIYEMRDEVEEPYYIDTEPDYTPIEELNVSSRSIRALKDAGVFSIEKLLEIDDSEIGQLQGLEEDDLLELKVKIGEFRLLEAVLSEAVAEEQEKKQKNYWAMLDELVGLENVKIQVKKLAALARMKEALPERDLTGISLHTAFLGSPGTAKTTVARILAGLLHEIGLLESEEILEVSRADLVAGYVGQTAERTKEVFEEARGRLLFIDEAYALADHENGTFGQEAIDELVLQMENQRSETVVIFAGYPDKMKTFIDRNPGLRSRIPYQITFNDYTADELLQITKLEAKKKGFSIRKDAVEKVRSFCEAAEGNGEAGNGRFCRNLTEHALLNYAQRVFGNEKIPDEVELALACEDFEAPEVLRKGKGDGIIGFKYS